MWYQLFNQLSFSPISRKQKVIIGMALASYSYGFYRSWTLPIWYNEYTKKRSEIPIRLGMSNVMGIIYVIPPFCLIKYAELGMRIYDVYCPESRFNKSVLKTHGDHWKEWGFYQPRML
jgi:hypothetical protein